MNSLLHSKYLRALTLIVVLQAALFYTASHGDSMPLRAPLKEFPAVFGAWSMLAQIDVDPETAGILKADDTLLREYSGPEGQANLFIAYFETQRQGQSPHSPKNCLPGSGFQVISDASGRIDIPVAGGSIHVNRYVVSRGEDERVVMYWYQSQGRVIADEFAAKFYLIADSIRYHRSNTSLVRIEVPVTDRMPREKASQTAIEFVQAAYPVVSSWLPR
jgi:EpsI family protein